MGAVGVLLWFGREGREASKPRTLGGVGQINQDGNADMTKLSKCSKLRHEVLALASAICLVFTFSCYKRKTNL